MSEDNSTIRFGRRAFVAGLGASALTLAAPGAAWAAGKVKVVCTLPDLAAIASAVGGDRVVVTALARPSEDPHYVDARPSHIIKLNKADLLVVNGLQLEVGWLPNLLTRARNGKIQPGAPGYLDASTVVDLMQIPTMRIDRSMGDIHPGGNPHYTFDPRRAISIARAVGGVLARIDPSSSAQYEARAAAFIAQLEALARKHRARFAKLPADRRRVVTYHASTIYLTDWLGLTEVIQVEPKPGIAPNPQHVARVLKTMRARGAKVIIQEEFYPRKVSAKLTELAGGELVVIQGGARVGDGQTYVQRIDAMAEKIHAAFKKKS